MPVKKKNRLAIKITAKIVIGFELYKIVGIMIAKYAAKYEGSLNRPVG